MSQQEKAGCLGQFLQMLGLGDRPEPTEPLLPYHLKPDFLSPAELSLYHVLRSVVGGQATVLAKVRLGDLFYPKTGDRSENAQYRNKIDRKHVDFLLCEPQTMRPLTGIELDDASHGPGGPRGAGPVRGAGVPGGRVAPGAHPCQKELPHGRTGRAVAGSGRYCAG